MDWAFDITRKNRDILKRFLQEFSLEQLNKIPEGFNNNIFWNIAHVVVTQQLLIYNMSGLKMPVDEELVNKYRKDTKVENDVTQVKVDELIKLLHNSLDQLIQDYKNNLFKSYNEYTVSTNSTLTNVEDAIQFNNFHEGIHLGYILAMKKHI